VKGKEVVSYEGVHCANCATPMQGEFCHACGQSIHTVLKPAHHLLEDTVETFLHVDGRLLHTLPPLLAKPGFLTLEYFAGRRQRYIAPFRLMFVLCLLAFFLTHVAIDMSVGKSDPTGAHVEKDTFDGLDTPAEVRKALDKQLADLQQAKARTANVPGVEASLNAAENELRDQATARIAELERGKHAAGDAAPAATAAAAPASSAPAPAASEAPADATSTAAASTASGKKHRGHSDQKAIKQWLTGHDHVHIAWLPAFMNTRLDHSLGNLRDNLNGLNSSDPDVHEQAVERIKAGIFGALPQTMFVLMPVFALLLKLFYLFKRRLYMEHLIVALHSHAFLFAILLIGALLSLLKGWIVPHAAWAEHPFFWLEVALSIWAPLYLLLMQKRIYRQGWVVTVLKYLMIGWCYMWLLGTFLTGALALGFAH
jgi:hypothetical protein